MADAILSITPFQKHFIILGLFYIKKASNLLKLSSEKALFLDKLIRTNRSDFILFEIDSIVQITLISSDLSQMIIIKLERSFFELFECNCKLTFSILPEKIFSWPRVKKFLKKKQRQEL